MPDNIRASTNPALLIVDKNVEMNLNVQTTEQRMIEYKRICDHPKLAPALACSQPSDLSTREFKMLSTAFASIFPYTDPKC